MGTRDFLPVINNNANGAHIYNKRSLLFKPYIINKENFISFKMLEE